jgi:hypothetical protein
MEEIAVEKLEKNWGGIFITCYESLILHLCTKTILIFFLKENDI